MTCIVASQSISDFDVGESSSKNSGNFKEPVIENCNNYIVLRQNSAVNSDEWAKILGTEETLNITYRLGQNDSYLMAPTGDGTARKERKFLYHPDEIKTLDVGKAIYLSKDTKEHGLIDIRKGF